MKKNGKEIRWHKLDNTAKIFPVIANEKLSNVFRLSVTLKEPIKKEELQQALEIILPWFQVFHVRLRRGFFWYYFETNKKTPVVEEEVTYPCRFIDRYSNHNFLFRVTYYKKRINLEVFHVLTDGLGASVFLKELTYQYLRLVHSELAEVLPKGPSKESSLNIEDSYLKYYKKVEKKGYKKKKAVALTGKLLPPTVMQIIHGYMNVPELKNVCKKYGVSINQYLVAVLVYAIYKEDRKEQPGKNPISINIPVNLRTYFESTTTKNFFAVLLAEFEATKEAYSFEDILSIVTVSIQKQMTKEQLERLISYNVSNEKRLIIRAVPLVIKNLVIRLIYRQSSKAFTTTLTNLGALNVLSDCKRYVDHFSVLLSVSKKQALKTSVCSYDNQLVFTFCSVLEDRSIQKAFFRKLVSDGISVLIESNGGYDDEM